ncbi:MAG: ABC transporter ATP-binding protein [Saprospiraceae bacterium]|nr:ABC transporter ATP-binding protein [Saprospiraceae bacterium]
MITIEQLHKSFGRNHVLRGIDLDLGEPGITAVLGPNASGKTTLIKSILGMVIPDEGNITMNDQSILGEWRYRDQIDYLPQIARFPENLRVRELIAMIKSLRSRASREQELIDFFDIRATLDQRLGHLSGGTRQKVNLVVAFMYDNPLMILDEPSAGLDPLAIQRLKSLIFREKGKGKQILITTHIMSLVEELADEIVFLLEGRIHFRGSLARLRKLYGEEDVEACIARMLDQNQPKIEVGA